MEKNEYRLVIDIKEGVVSQEGGNKESDVEAKQNKALKNLVKHRIAEPFINATKQMVQNEVNTKLGSGELSQRISFGMQAAHSIYSSSVYGMSLAATLGLSTGAGIGIGLAVAGTQFLINTMVKEFELQNAKSLEDEQLTILRGRAGVQFNMSRRTE